MKTKKGIKSAIAGLILIMGAALFGQAEQQFTIPPGSYYNDANLAALNEKGTRKHAPLMILIDQKNIETPTRKTLALTKAFSDALQAPFFPILVSQSIAHNYVVRKRDKRLTWTDYVSVDQWNLYNVPGTQFLLFVPKHYLAYYRTASGFNLNNLSNISNLLKDPYMSLIPWIEETKAPNSTTFTIQDFQKIFITTNEKDKQPIWDVVLIGHGKYDPAQIGGLPPSDMQQILAFFTQMPTATVYIASCYAGGKNIDLIQFEKAIDNRYIRPLNYILIVGGITDTPTGLKSETYLTFFDLAAKRKGKSKMLNNLLKEINTMNINSNSPHGSRNIPQVWLPGGSGFQTFNIDQQVTTLGWVKVRVHEDEDEPIDVPNTTVAILIYPDNINVRAPLHVHLSKIIINMPAADLFKDILELREEEWKELPSSIELLTQLYPKIQKLDKEDFPALVQLTKQKQIEPTTLQEAVFFFYPQFISMIRGDAQHHIAKIELKIPKDNPAYPYTGVMHFIRDAFFELAGLKSKKTFRIDELTGNNDISLLLELGRLQKEVDIQQQHPLENLLAKKINKPITLKNVTIETGTMTIGVKGRKTLLRKITFEYEGTLWKFIYQTQKRK